MRRESVDLRICRGLEKRSTPLELAFASTSAMTQTVEVIVKTGTPRDRENPFFCSRQSVRAIYGLYMMCVGDGGGQREREREAREKGC
jgi:hypothetical protein